jgi:hypothetical protein
MSVTPQAVGRLTGQTVTLEMGGVNQGIMRSFEGGSAVGNVVVEKLGPDLIAHKHLAGVNYEDITVTVGVGVGKDLYEWTKASFDHKHIRKDISFKRSDINQNVTWQMDVFHTLITSVGFPELDGSSKDMGLLTLTLSPEMTRMKAGSGKLSQSLGSKAKQWLTCNFRLTIPGLDCTRVSKIGALNLTAPTTSNPVGEQRDYEKIPSAITFPNLVVTMPEQLAQTFTDWHNTFVIQGKNDQSQEKEGTLEILAADMKEVLYTLKFHGLGIFRLAPEKLVAQNQLPRVTAEMYCETMEFGYGSGAVGS